MSYICFVVNEEKQPLMPTNNPKKVRRLLKFGRAEIYKRNPFTIRLLYRVEPNNQLVEIGMDTGYQHIGLSVKSEKHEYWSAEYSLLPNEKIHHQNQLMYRRVRRNRLRYRPKKFDSRTDAKRLTNKKEGWLAPSIKNKADRHVDLIKQFQEVCPVTSVTLEMGQFDTNVLHSVEAGQPIPQNEDYQKGMRYGFDTLREAVFQRDNYTCQICGKGLEDNAILCVHHIGFRKRDRSNRSSNLLTVCSHCHTSANHQPGGKLWDLKSARTVKEASYMNQVRLYIYNQVKDLGIPVHMVYGTQTKRKRKKFKISKSHANDAYCIGEFMSKHRAVPRYFQKRRRNNRELVIRFTDAKYIDIRDGEEKEGKVLSCGRTKRSEPRNGPNNLRKYRGKKVRKGCVAKRTRRFDVFPHDLYRYEGQVYEVKGSAAGYRTVKGKKISDSSKDKIVFIVPADPKPKTKTALKSKCELVKKQSGGWTEVKSH